MTYTDYINEQLADATLTEREKLAFIVAHVLAGEERRARQERHERILHESRFVDVRRKDGDEEASVRKTTESEISSYYDMADCHGDDASEFYYLDDDGKLYPITTGAENRHEPDLDGNGEPPFNYASRAMMANGKVVGHIELTDH